jgi:hypothetical protein
LKPLLAHSGSPLHQIAPTKFGTVEIVSVSGTKLFFVEEFL